jgi:TolB-like protein
VLEELSGYLVNSRKLVVVDRNNLNVIRQEEQFQLSGEVSDESAQSIGKKLGAQVVVSGSLSSTGKVYRFRIRALVVETAVVSASSALNINPQEAKVISLLDGATVIADNSLANELEYTITCSGSVQGYITVKREKSGRVIITPVLTKGGFHLDNENCSLVPPGMDNIYVWDDTRNVIIEGNTAIQTAKDGIWFKTTVDGNTTTITASASSDWQRTTVNGNITTITDSTGKSESMTKVILGNTITYTHSDGRWEKVTTDGNTKTVTRSDVSSWHTVTMSGNTKTTTFYGSGSVRESRWVEILDSHGNTISIHKD